jgi:hypothetical protein
VAEVAKRPTTKKSTDDGKVRFRSSAGTGPQLAPLPRAIFCVANGAQ